MDFHTTPRRNAQGRPIRHMDEDLGRQKAQGRGKYLVIWDSDGRQKDSCEAPTLWAQQAELIRLCFGTQGVATPLFARSSDASRNDVSFLNSFQGMQGSTNMTIRNHKRYQECK